MKYRRSPAAAALILAALPHTASHAATVSTNLFSHNVVVTNQFTTRNHTDGTVVANKMSVSNDPVFQNNVFVTGSMTGNRIHLNGTNDTLFHDSPLPIGFATQNGGKSFVSGNELDAAMASLTDDISAFSSVFAAQAQTAGAAITIQENKNVTFKLPTGAKGNVYFTLDLSKQNIFSLQNLNIAFSGLGSGAFAVVNVINAVGQTAINATNFNFAQQNATTGSSVLWNFTNATSFTNNGAFYGSVLGPGLTFDTNNRNVYGGLYVHNLTQLGGEIHYPLFVGNVPPAPKPEDGPTASVPLPSSALAGLALLGSLALSRRQFARRANH